MFDSIINVVFAHKPLVIAVATFAVIFGSLSTIPNATAQTSISFENGITIDTNNGRYVHVQVGGGQGVVVNVEGGPSIDLGGLLGGFFPPI